MSFLLYTLIVAGAVGALAELVGGLQSTFGATARIFEILDTSPRSPTRRSRSPSPCCAASSSSSA
jgi:ABC-type multidrug transport system fused ATPase/permease subunit